MIGRALRAQARVARGDVVLLGLAVAAVALSATLATSIPAELAAAPPDVRRELAAPFDAVLATYAGMLAAVYGSFRYTIDQRDGVIAQRLMLQSRWATLAVRVPASAVGGAVVALAAVGGGRSALALAMGGIPVVPSAVVATLALGAAAALWGLGLGIIIRAHLAALFLVALSMGVAVVLAAIASPVAVFLPLLAGLQAFGFDVTAVGVAPGAGLAQGVAGMIAGGWLLLALGAGGALFLRRDVTSG